MRIVFCAMFLTLAATLHASSIGIAVNGTCEAGSCSPTALPLHSSEALPIDYTLTLADGDKYLINGSFTASNTSGSVAGAVNHLFQVTYEGDGSGGVSGADTVMVQADYSIATTRTSEIDYRDVIGAFGPTIAAGSSGSSCANGGTIGCVGTLHAPGVFNKSSPDFTLEAVDGAFEFDPYFTSNFAAGSAVGSYVVWGQTRAIPLPAVPEPASTGLLAFGAALLTLGRTRFRRSC